MEEFTGTINLSYSQFELHMGDGGFVDRQQAAEGLVEVFEVDWAVLSAARQAGGVTAVATVWPEAPPFDATWDCVADILHPLRPDDDDHRVGREWIGGRSTPTGHRRPSSLCGHRRGSGGAPGVGRAIP
jgi:hypothetical protein